VRITIWLLLDGYICVP